MSFPVPSSRSPDAYRGRLAPSPTGLLHLGHARTFWTAQERAVATGGVLVLREEDLDVSRVRPEFSAALLEDLRWFGFRWQEGPDRGGTFAPYVQRQRMNLYAEVFQRLAASGAVYPCRCTRREVLAALSAPHAGEEEPVYPGTCRANRSEEVPAGTRVNWRFRVPDGEPVAFRDAIAGPQSYTSGSDFGDFVVWRGDGVPAYQLACVIDDALMKITEVVRGADLLLSTARQLLLYKALGWTAPEFAHCPLVLDESGRRLAKRHDGPSLRRLRESGLTPDQIRAGWSSAPRSACFAD